VAEHRIAVKVRLTILVVGSAAVPVGDVQVTVRAEMQITGVVIGLRVLDREEPTPLCRAGLVRAEGAR
jgi:hypothetical protein